MKPNWQTKKLDDVCNVEYGTRVVNKKHGGTLYPVYGGGGATFFIDRSNRFDRLVVARFAMSEQCTRFVGGEFFLNDSGLTVSPKNDREISQDFLDWQMLCLNDKIYSLARGSAQKNLDVPAFRNMEVSFPESIAEQKQIVKILDEVFEKLEKTKQNVEKNMCNSKKLFEAYLQNIFANPKKGWKNKVLDDVCSLYQGIAINSKTKHALVEKSDLPLLRIKDLKNNTVEQYIDPNNYPLNALVNEDDIIYTRTGSLGLVFRGKRGVLHNNSFKVVPTLELSKDYLFIWLQNPIFKSKILNLAMRAAQPDITHAIFKLQQIDIPPLSEQKAIVKKLDLLSSQTKKLESLYKTKLYAIEELKKSILNKAFSKGL